MDILERRMFLEDFVIILNYYKNNASNKVALNFLDELEINKSFL